MVVAVVEDHVALLVELGVWAGHVSPKVEALEAGSCAACRQFGHYLNRVGECRRVCSSVVFGNSEDAFVCSHGAASARGVWLRRHRCDGGVNGAMLGIPCVLNAH